MRPYIPAVVVVVVFVLLLGAGFVTSSLFESPQNKFLSEADRKIELAQRMLRDYEGGHPRLVAALDILEKLPTSTAPATEPEAAPLSDPASPAAQESARIDDNRRRLRNRFDQMGGTPGEPGGEIASREQLRQVVESNADLLDKALTQVREVINGGSDGEDAIRGDTLPVATRLEAILLSHKADLMRRQARVQQGLALAEQANFADVLASWRQARSAVNSLKLELAGTKGGTLTLTGGTQPAEGAAAAAPTPATPQTRRAAPRPRSGGGLFGRIRNLLPGGRAAQPDAPEPTTPVEPLANQAGPDAPVTAEAPAPAGPVAIAEVPPLDQRIRNLQAQGEKLDAEIADARKEVERLTGILNGLRTRLNQARSEAESSEKAMMALEDAGIQAGDPNSLQRFITEYNQQSKKNRASAREAAALEQGVIRNARPDADDATEITTAPLVPIDQAKEPAAEAGVLRLEADLKAAQLLVETRQKLRQAIDRQIDELKAHGAKVQQRLAQAQQWQDKLAREAAEVARRATAAADQAWQYEGEAVEILNGDGRAAASRAETAATAKGNDISAFYQRNAPTVAAPQVTFISGHAKLLAGDVEYGLALVYAQRADLLAAQQELLAGAQALGLDPATLLTAPAGGQDASESSAPAAGTPTTQPQGIAQSVQEARAEAVKAANAALDAYESASEALNRLWVVHTQIAAVEYLLSTLTAGDEAATHRANALREYRAATADRVDRPEARAFQAMIDTLTQAQQPPAQ